MKKIFLLLFSTFVILFCTSEVSAEEISYKRISGVYYNQWVNGNLQSNTVTMFYFGSTLAYCIEPGVAINDKNYNSSKDWSKTSFSEEQKTMMEKIGYYGYEYPGHQTPAYYLAAQELIWNISNPNVKVSWSSEKNNAGRSLSYEKEKQDILELIANDNLRPSFSETKITGEIGTEVTITDDNKVLDNYVLSESQYHNLEIKDNQLFVRFNDEVVPEENIKLVRKSYDSQVLIVYTKGNNQKLATLRFSSPVETFFELENKITPVPEEPKEETPEIVKVPNTSANASYLFSSLFVTLGLIVRAKKLL